MLLLYTKAVLTQSSHWLTLKQGCPQMFDSRATFKMTSVTRSTHPKNYVIMADVLHKDKSTFTLAENSRSTSSPIT